MSRVKSPEELLPDGTELVSFTIPGRATTKKTHQNVVYVKGHPRVLPSQQYVKYEKSCKEPCLKAWKAKKKAAMDFGIGIYLKIHLNNWIVGDHTGYMQAIGDILQKWEVIADDSWIAWLSSEEHWLGEVDKENPRIEIKIVRLYHPKEAFRENKEAAEEKKASKVPAQSKKKK